MNCSLFPERGVGSSPKQIKQWHNMQHPCLDDTSQMQVTILFPTCDTPVSLWYHIRSLEEWARYEQVLQLHCRALCGASRVRLLSDSGYQNTGQTSACIMCPPRTIRYAIPPTGVCFPSQLETIGNVQNILGFDLLWFCLAVSKQRWVDI